MWCKAPGYAMRHGRARGNLPGLELVSDAREGENKSVAQKRPKRGMEDVLQWAIRRLKIEDVTPLATPLASVCDEFWRQFNHRTLLALAV